MKTFRRTFRKSKLVETAEERLNKSSRNIENIVREASRVVTEFQLVQNRVQEFAKDGKENGPKEQAT